MPYNSDQLNLDLSESQIQWDWLKNELELARLEHRKVIPMTHIFAGAYIYNADGFQVLEHWHDEFSNEYFELMKEYKDTVLIEIAGHDHMTSLRAIEDEEENYRNLMIVPAISPNFRQMPGVATVKIDGDKLVAKDLEATFINLD